MPRPRRRPLEGYQERRQERKQGQPGEPPHAEPQPAPRAEPQAVARTEPQPEPRAEQKSGRRKESPSRRRYMERRRERMQRQGGEPRQEGEPRQGGEPRQADGQAKAGRKGEPRKGPRRGQPPGQRQGERPGPKAGPKAEPRAEARPEASQGQRQERRAERRIDRRPERRHPQRLPADGIRAKTQSGEFGETWWARRWVNVLESFGYGGRLARGRTYARGGAVVSLEIGRGNATARVQGSRPSPYTVRLSMPPLKDEQWDRAIDAMAEQAIVSAKLLAGEMPLEIEEAFAAAEVPLFPRSARDLATTCSCPDPANPCKHIAAVYYLLGERFDSDPFLLLQLRGRDKEQLIAALRARRAESAADLELPDEPIVERAPALAELLAAFDTPAEPLGAIAPQIAPPDPEAPLLRRYGPPPAATEEDLTVVYRTLSKLALDRLLGDE
jgi:uncharacterized Zn finger protein